MSVETGASGGAWRFRARRDPRVAKTRREAGLAHPLLCAPAVIFVLIAFFVPLGVLLVYSLWPTTAGGQIIHHWTLSNWSRALTNWTYLQTLLQTFWFVGLSSVITVVLTFPFAYFVSAKARPQRRVFWILVAILPFWTSYLIRVFAWENLFGDNGLINDALSRIGLISQPLSFFGFNRPAIVITFVYLLFPLSFLATFITLERMDPALLEASGDLGATPFKRMLRIILPIARSGLLAGFILSFITMAGDYVTPQLIGGTQGTFYANLIVNQFGDSLQWGFGAALSMVLLISVFVLLLVLRKTSGAVQAGEYTRRYTKERAPFLFSYSLLFVAFLYIPIALLLIFSCNDSSTVGFPFNGITFRWFQTVFNDPQVASAFKTSITVAAVAVGASLVVGTPAAMYLTRNTGRWRALALAIVSTPLFLPPVVLGLAIIIGLHALNVTRGLWTIMIGHTIIVLPIVTLLIATRLEGLDRNQELAAMDLGATPWRTFVKVSLPQAMPGIIAAAMIAFAVSMDEFIMTFLVTGSQTTLPLYIFGSIRFVITPELTAISCLLLAASCVLIVLGASIAFGRGRITRLARS
jgi:ABC-type spermidine/putrescine transport system permease subunit I